ncbi:MAG: hypothetical protein IPK26_08400 [Planctomycetes bacterium]|nr:hypothetical protein [Planctomycetota bacterium]
MLLFGIRPNRYLPHAGITVVAFHGTEKDYDARERALLRGPIVGLFSPQGIVESGCIEQALEFVRRNTRVSTARLPLHRNQ